MSGNLRLSGVKFQKSRKVGLEGQIIRQNEETLVNQSPQEKREAYEIFVNLSPRAKREA